MKEGLSHELPRRPKHKLAKQLGTAALVVLGSAQAKAQNTSEPYAPPERVADLKEMTPAIAKDIERWIQTDFYRTQDTLRYLAENASVNAIMAEQELEKLGGTASDDGTFTRMGTIGVRASQVPRMLPEGLQEKEGDSLGSLLPSEWMKYDKDQYLAATPRLWAELELRSYPHDKDSVVESLYKDRYVYESWVKDKLREVYQRHDSIRNITVSTRREQDLDIMKLTELLRKSNEENETATIVEVVKKEGGLNNLPEWNIRAELFEKSSRQAESPRFMEVSMYAVDPEQSGKLLLYPFIRKEFAQGLQAHFGSDMHYTNGLVVIDLGPQDEGMGKSEWIDLVKSRFKELGLQGVKTNDVDWEPVVTEPDVSIEANKPKSESE